MIDRLIARRLSGKLLMLTIGFVMLAELVIFIPSAATYRQDWLDERAQQAGLLALAITGVPDYEGSDILSKQFMDDTDVIMMASKRDGMTELVLGLPPESDNWEVVDMRQTRRLPSFGAAFRSFFGDSDGYLRVIAHSPVEGQDALELIVPHAKLQQAMHDYFRRIAYISLLIAVITGLLIYLSILFMIIRPIEKLVTGLSDFRKNPEKRHANLPPGNRKDEIGQLQREFFDMKHSVRASFKQRERLATLGMAVAKINHDLRNVLTSAQLVSDRLATNTDERVAKMGERLTRAIDRGVKLTGEVLNFSQSKEAPPDFQDVRISLLLGEAAGDTLSSFGTGARKISFQNHVPSELQVRADPDHTYRIFHNLFRNAAQAMSGLRDDMATRILSAEAETIDGLVKITVHDTGGGLPPKAQLHLFKAFASSSGSGNTGLGLTISKELAEAQGGDLEMVSTGADGTVFSVTLQAKPK